MRAIDIITKKRNGGVLDSAEIEFLIKGYVAQEIPEYQISAWLMAVYFQGMTFEETGLLTRTMINSGSVFNLESIAGPLIDKHSTGGVGDKTSLILAPIVAAAGLKVPMMSGRSLGHTGGTLDKLDSIPGFRTQLSQNEFVHILKTCGFAMTGQTREVVPADRLLYALRDVTATVESIPLITASILSKKFAEGAKGFVFDVKTGSGAFMKKPEQARALANSLVNTAHSLHCDAVALITDMDFPLGYATGNFLEIEESWRCLKPTEGLWNATISGDVLTIKGISAELMEVTLELAAQMLVLGGLAKDRISALSRCLETIENGSALRLFEENVSLQGGDMAKLRSMFMQYRAPYTYDIISPSSGSWTDFDAYQAGLASVYLGVGRNKANDTVLPDVGFIVHEKRGTQVTSGTKLVTLYAQDITALEKAAELIQKSIRITSARYQPKSLIHEVIKTT